MSPPYNGFMLVTHSNTLIVKVSVWLACLPIAVSGCERSRSQTAPESEHRIIGASIEGNENQESDRPYRPWKFLVLHHSGTDAGSIQSIDAEHRRRVDDKGQHWRGIGYHFVIGNGQGMLDGEIFPTFRWLEQLDGAHAGKREFNEYGIGICLIGNFDQQVPTAAQLRSSRKLIRELQQQFAIADHQVLRHGELKATACPGKLFSTELVVQNAVGHGGPPATDMFIPLNPAARPDTEEIDNVASTLGSSSSGRRNLTFERGR